MLCANCFRVAVLFTVLIFIPGCRSTAPQLRASNSLPNTHARSDVLGSAEIQTVSLNNALEAVMRFRPEFLRTHGSPAAVGPNAGIAMVYLDGIRQGGPDALRSIPAAAIYEIRYLSASAAADQYGPYYPGGVIAVRTRR
jgi:hypothetical protein